jgi:hypothetical protein
MVHDTCLEDPLRQPAQHCTHATRWPGPFFIKGSYNRIHLTEAILDELDDWRMLLASLSMRPATHIQEIIPNFLTWTGAHDASGRAMGGVFSGPNGTPYL